MLFNNVFAIHSSPTPYTGHGGMLSLQYHMPNRSPIEVGIEIGVPNTNKKNYNATIFMFFTHVKGMQIML